MKKILPTLILFVGLLSCSSDETTIQDKIIDEPIVELEINYQGLDAGTTKYESGLYDNAYDISYSNLTDKDIIGHVEITVKEYGIFKSNKREVKAIKNMGTLFTIPFQTDKIIDDSYITKVEFVRE